MSSYFFCFSNCRLPFPSKLTNAAVALRLERITFSPVAAHEITPVLMSFISVAVGVRPSRNNLLNLLKNQSPTAIILKNKLTWKMATARSMSSDSKCIFCQIVNKTAEANILHEVRIISSCSRYYLPPRTRS